MTVTTHRRPGPPEAPRIDPRIRQRRIAVRRDEGRRRLRRLLALIALAVLLAAGVAAANSPLLDVDRIVVEGARSTAPEQVVSASGIDRGDPILRIDVDAATSRVEALPWIETAAVRRDYPGRAEIVVTERSPVGVLRSGTTEVLVDGEGHVLGPPAGVHADLARLEVAGAPPEPGERAAPPVREAVGVLEAVSAEIPGAVVRLRGDELDVELPGGLRVRLGTVGEIDAKLRSLRTVLAEVDLRCASLLDLRVPERPALRDAC